VRRVAPAALALAAVLLVLATLEVGLRIHQSATRGVPFGASAGMLLDPLLGWKGHEIVGDPAARRPKLGFVGDSYTMPLEDLDVPSMCYSVLGRMLDVEVFAYGGGGYGTLQEALVIERFAPIVRPDIVVLQVSSNDFINNSWELERASYFNNNLAPRPYLMGSAIEYHAPPWFSPTLMSHSRLAPTLVIGTIRAQALLAGRGVVQSVESAIHREGLGFPPFRRAVDTTDQLIGRIQGLVGSTPLVAFPTDSFEPYFDEWRRIFERRSVPFVESVVERVQDAERKGAKLRLSDGAHWNHGGQRICGEVLAAWLRSNIPMLRRRR
jgi:hypothetical protein